MQPIRKPSKPESSIGLPNTAVYSPTIQQPQHVSSLRQTRFSLWMSSTNFCNVSALLGFHQQSIGRQVRNQAFRRRLSAWNRCPHRSINIFPVRINLHREKSITYSAQAPSPSVEKFNSCGLILSPWFPCLPGRGDPVSKKRLVTHTKLLEASWLVSIYWAYYTHLLR